MSFKTRSATKPNNVGELALANDVQDKLLPTYAQSSRKSGHNIVFVSVCGGGRGGYLWRNNQLHILAKQ